MTLQEYIDLIKDFAREDPDLLHIDNSREAVYACNYEEAVSLLSDISNRMVLLLPPYEKRVLSNQAMGNIWIKGGLAVAVQYVEAEDYKGRLAIQSKAEAVLDRLYAYLFNTRGKEMLYGFDTASWESDTIGPIGTGHYGYYAEFNIKDGVKY